VNWEDANLSSRTGVQSLIYSQIRSRESMGRTLSCSSNRWGIFTSTRSGPSKHEKETPRQESQERAILAAVVQILTSSHSLWCLVMEGTEHLRMLSSKLTLSDPRHTLGAIGAIIVDAEGRTLALRSAPSTAVERTLLCIQMRWYAALIFPGGT
jgi:hypothetical protein